MGYPGIKIFFLENVDFSKRFNYTILYIVLCIALYTTCCDWRTNMPGLSDMGAMGMRKTTISSGNRKPAKPMTMLGKARVERSSNATEPMATGQQTTMKERVAQSPTSKRKELMQSLPTSTMSLNGYKCGGMYHK